MFAKLIGFSVVLTLIGVGVKQAGGQIEFVQNIAKTVGTMVELNGIKKIIYIDFVIAHRDMASMSEDDWSSYIRQHMSSDDRTRDTSKDLWLTPYHVSIGRGYGESGASEDYAVRSAGPDRQYRTDDDIVASGRTM
jgi:hypothetical protein